MNKDMDFKDLAHGQPDLGSPETEDAEVTQRLESQQQTYEEIADGAGKGKFNKGFFVAAGTAAVLGVLAAGAIYMQSSDNTPKEAVGAEITKPGALQSNMKADGVAEYSNVTNIAERNKAEEAAKEGTSYVPSANTVQLDGQRTVAKQADVSATTNIATPPAMGGGTAAGMPPPLPAAPTITQTPVPAATTAQTQAYTPPPMPENLVPSLQGLLATARPAGSPATFVSFSAMTAKGQSSSEAAINSGLQPKLKDGSTGTGAANLENLAAAATTLAFPGDVVPAHLNFNANTDQPGPVKATIMAGPLKGATLMGTLSRKGYRAIAQFSTLILPDRSASIPIQAVNFDPVSNEVGGADSVNKHLIVRWGVQPLMNALAAIGNVWVDAQKSTTTTANDTSSTTTTGGDGTVSDRAMAAIGIGEYSKLIGVEAGRLGTDPTVKLNSGIIGVMFLQEARYTPASALK